MKLNILKSLALAVTLTFALATAFAQDPDRSQDRKSKAGHMSVTGCLQKADSGGDATITGTDGKTYTLHGSGSVDLSKHIGHKVTVTGTMKSASSKDTSTTTDSHDLTVTDLKMVSTTCP